MNVYKQISSEEQVYERLQTAIKEKNGTELAELLRFASGYERRLAINLRTCEAARLCGYDMPPVNEYGWMEVDDLVKKSEVIQHEGKRYDVTIYVLQHPNGKWVTGYNVNLPTAGTSGNPSVFSDQYDSRAEAIKTRLDNLIEYTERNGSQEAATALRKQRADLSQLSLFA